MDVEAGSPSPVRALLIAHAQQAWNALLRQTGPLGAAATFVTILIVLFGLTPIALFGVGFGITMGRALARPETREIATGWLTGLHLSLVLAFGIWGGLSQVVRFEWETFRTFPVPASRLLLAELLLSPLDLAPLLSSTIFLGLAVGLGLHGAALLPGALLLGTCGVLGTLAVSTLVGSLRRAVLKSLSPSRLLVAATVVGAVAAWLAFARAEQALVAAKGAAAWLGANLPVARAHAALAPLAQGERGALLGFARSSLPEVAFTAALLLAALWAHSSTSRLEPAPPRGAASAPERLWSFGRPRQGIAMLFLRHLAASPLGKVALLLPLAMSGVLFLLARVVPPFGERISRVPPDFPWLTIALVACVVLLGEALWNQYGLDHHGIKTLLLLPVPPRELILGKLLGLTALYGFLSVSASLPLLFTLPVSAFVLAHGLATAPAAFLALAAAGHLVSARFPRLQKAQGQPSVMPPSLAFLTTGAQVAVALVLTAVSKLGGLAGPWGSVASLIVASLLAVAGYFLCLPFLERTLLACREHLVTELG